MALSEEGGCGGFTDRCRSRPIFALGLAVDIAADPGQTIPYPGRLLRRPTFAPGLIAERVAGGVLADENGTQDGHPANLHLVGIPHK
jgi:hypothetical protein